jgi:3-phenylpropionate/cinnamic acid dioxygenase small subunit
MSLSDRHDIIDLTIAYCWALDTRQWEDLRNVFLPDAKAVLGGSDLDGIDAIIARVQQALMPLDDSQHMVSTHQIHIDGDRATSRCYLQAQHVRHAAPGGPNFIVAGRYQDELVRTPHGWRIARRELIPMWREGNLAVVRPAE